MQVSGGKRQSQNAHHSSRCSPSQSQPNVPWKRPAPAGADDLVPNVPRRVWEPQVATRKRVFHTNTIYAPPKLTEVRSAEPLFSHLPVSSLHLRSHSPSGLRRKGGSRKTYDILGWLPLRHLIFSLSPLSQTLRYVPEKGQLRGHKTRSNVPLTEFTIFFVTASSPLSTRGSQTSSATPMAVTRPSEAKGCVPGLSDTLDPLGPVIFL